MGWIINNFPDILKGNDFFQTSTWGLIERVKKEGLYDETIRPDKDEEYGIDEDGKKPHRWNVEFDRQHVLRLIDQFHLETKGTQGFKSLDFLMVI